MSDGPRRRFGNIILSERADRASDRRHPRPAHLSSEGRRDARARLPRGLPREGNLRRPHRARERQGDPSRERAPDPRAPFRRRVVPAGRCRGRRLGSHPGAAEAGIGTEQAGESRRKLLAGGRPPSSAAARPSTGKKPPPPQEARNSGKAARLAGGHRPG